MRTAWLIEILLHSSHKFSLPSEKLVHEQGLGTISLLTAAKIIAVLGQQKAQNSAAKSTRMGSRPMIGIVKESFGKNVKNKTAPTWCILNLTSTCSGGNTMLTIAAKSIKMIRYVGLKTMRAFVKSSKKSD